MNPRPIARIKTARDRHETDRCKQTTSATMSPTGRNARVKNIPNAITVPEANASRMPANAGQPGRIVRPRGPGRQGQGGRRKQRVGRVGDRLEKVGGRGQGPKRRRRPGRRRS